MPYKPIPCAGNCGRQRQRGGRTDKTGLCWACWLKAGSPKPTRPAPPKPKAKVNKWPRRAVVTEQRADIESRYPTRSWWATTSREQFNANLAEEQDRLHAIGAYIPTSERPMTKNGMVRPLERRR